MKNEVALKVYEVNYEFIVKNYLSPSLWEKQWTLFVYKDAIIKLQLSSISVKPRRIWFDIKLNKDEQSYCTSICHYMDNSNYDVLKKQVNGAIESLINSLERHYICREDGYNEIKKCEYDEDDILRTIAEEFLDENGVTNKDIREVYIDNYVSNNSKVSIHLNNYIEGRKYRCLPDFWLVYYKATKQNEKYESVLNKLSTEKHFDELMKSIKESLSVFEDDKDDEKYNDYINDMKDLLEEI